MRSFYSAFLLCVAFPSFALDVTLYIHKDSSEVYGSIVHGCAFNTTDTYSSKSALLRVGTGEVLNVTVINRDTLEHTFTIDDVISTGNVIAPNGTATFTVTLNAAGSYRYYSDRSYGALIGAGGIILVGHQPYPAFYWNLFDLNSSNTYGLASGQLAAIPTPYEPDLFFMNGTHFPFTLDDPDTYVDVQMGDTVVIAIVNGGNMEHVFHFHGFHVRILDSKMQPERAGWIKDTFPVKMGEAMTVMLVAGQVGTYPVHDHFLIAVTNAGLYPGGMLTLINVNQ
ncbi:MAG: multicopper oxidase domain-containing protein [Flavobacteriales bacterium]|nr:multicopper oxidase domain-containing protein [Flavobacteriales bacterium]